MAFDQLFAQYFQFGPPGADAMAGVYNPYLVFLSYLIASIASFVALDMSAHLRRPGSLFFKISWLAGGAFVMGAGIWSMHFVGMLAFIMPMPMNYNLFWTGLSMLAAVVTAAVAFIFFTIKSPTAFHYLLSGILVGAAIPTMHYTGMAAMEGVKIHYYPDLFSMSILIAIVAASASIWLSVKSDRGTFYDRMRLKLGSALIMGLAITGMHYTGMAAAVFTPLADHHLHGSSGMDPILLSLFIAAVIMSIMIAALILSVTRYLYSTTVKDQNEFLLAVLNNMCEGVLACDAEGKITLINRAALNLLNEHNLPKSVSELIKKFPIKLNQTGKLAVGNENPFNRALRGETVRDVEVTLNDKKENKHTLLIDGQVLRRTETGEKLGAIVVWNDVSKKMEAEFSNRAKTNFLANMSHEIRSPLNVVMGMLQLIMSTQLNEKQKSYIETGLEGANSLLKILGDVLDLSKIESGKETIENVPFNLKQELNSLINIYSVQCHQKGLLLNFTIDKNFPDTVIGDPVKLKQVVNNLINNAIKFTPTGGKIYVDVKVLDLEANHCTFQISVKDTGVGIPKEAQSRIFERYTQADEGTMKKYGGTGLGLTIIKELLALMGGQIDCISDGKTGTTFIVYLSLACQDSFYSQSDLINLDENDSQFNASVLVVDDSKLNQFVSCDLLKLIGCKTDVASSGTEAIEAIKNKDYDLILMDCHMPGMDGFITTEKIREFESRNAEINKKNIIIAITSNALKGTKEKCLAAGMNDYLTKPISLGRLKEVLKRYCSPSQENFISTQHFQQK